MADVFDQIIESRLILVKDISHVECLKNLHLPKLGCLGGRLWHLSNNFRKLEDRLESWLQEPQDMLKKGFERGWYELRRKG